MRLTLPFAYRATVFTSSGERVDRTYRETMEFDVPEVTSEEAPVALVWRGEKLMTKGYGKDEVPVPTSVRAHADALYAPFRVRRWRGVGQDDEIGPVPLQDIHDAVADAPVSPGDHRGRRSPGASMHTFFKSSYVLDAAEVRLKGPPKPSTVLNSRREEALAAVAREAARFLVVDGVLHASEDEPVLVVGRRGGKTDARVYLATKVEDGLQTHTFPLSAREAAVAKAAHHHGVDPSAVKVEDHEVTLPSVMRRHCEDVAFRAAVYRLTSTVARDLARMPRSCCEAFMDLVEQGDRKDERGDRLPPDPVATYGLARTLCDEAALAPLHDRDALRDHDFDLSRAREWLGVADLTQEAADALRL